MPGYDGTGPLGQGALTGWGRGRCARPGDRAASTEVSDPYRGGGRGPGRWGYGGGRRFRGRGGGRGRGFGRAGGAIRDFSDLEETRRRQDPSFGARLEALEAELERVGKLLSRNAPDDGQGPE